MTRLEIRLLCVVWAVALFSCNRPEEPKDQQPVQPVVDSVRTPVMNGIPIVGISYEGELRQSSYTKADIHVFYNGWQGRFDSIPSQGRVKIHGNSTAVRDKCPYKLKLDVKRNWFGFGDAKQWVLLANSYDASLLRNYLAMTMGRALGMKDTPECTYVDVVVNGQYRGNYLLCETPQLAPSRVNHASYLIEVDHRYGEQDSVLHIPMIQSDDTYIHYRIQEPEAPSQQQMAFLKHFFVRYDSLMVEASHLRNDMPEARLRLRQELDAVVDFESFVGFWIVQEMFSNPDSWNFSSVWMNIKQDGKLHMGPLWDFDLAAGNYSTIDAGSDQANGFYRTEGYYLFTQPYVHHYLNLYWAEAQQYWRDHRAAILEMIAGLEDVDEAFRASFDANFELWPSSYFVNIWCGYDHDANVEYLYSWLLSRYAWMNQVFNQTGIE